MKNLTEYFPDLTENTASEAAKAMNDAIETVDENLSYKDFALAVAAILKDEYGSHNFGPFMEVLHAELGMKESLNENQLKDLGQQFSDKFNVRAYGDLGRIEILQRGDIDKDEFEKMIQWVESKGYKVDRDQSNEWFDWDDDRYWYPRIKISK